MKLSQKQNCERCRAWTDTNGLPQCELGFDNCGPYIPNMNIYRSVPQEPCYKPLTINDLIEAQRLVRIERSTPRVIN